MDARPAYKAYTLIGYSPTAHSYGRNICTGLFQPDYLHIIADKIRKRSKINEI